MSSDRSAWWDAVSPYLDEVLELPPERRALWLATLRAQQPEIGAHLEQLLDDHDALARARFLEESAPVAATAIAGPAAGTIVGAYTLVTQIGEGGMGSVWLAERRDGEIQHKAAIKFLGWGGDRTGWRERFLRERQLLASLSHPSIVHVIDAGHTPDGRPYLVMEYVDGQPIDAHCAGIPVAGRLHLFVRVCDAVSYAHQRLIVHRDLKPSNILVDGAAQPKLLDFGIAKLLDDTGE